MTGTQRDPKPDWSNGQTALCDIGHMVIERSIRGKCGQLLAFDRDTSNIATTDAEVKIDVISARLENMAHFQGSAMFFDVRLILSQNQNQYQTYAVFHFTGASI